MLPDAFVPIAPAPGDTLDGYASVEFKWAPIPNATFYVMETSKYPDFPFVYDWYFTETPNVTATNLAKDKSYYWRVRAYNHHHTCPQISAPSFFRTGASLTASQEMASFYDISLQPNPLRAGLPALLRLTAPEAANLTVSLHSAAGQVVQTFGQQVTAGENRILVPAQQLPAGLYWVSLQSETSVQTIRLVIAQ